MSADDSHNNYYLFLIDGAGGWAFFKAIDNQYQLVLPAGFSSAIKTGPNAINTLDVRNDLNHYTLSVNGTVVAQTDDPDNPYGYVGVYAGENTEAVFTNFTLGTPQG